MRKLTLSLAVLAALLPGQGQTLGLGEIELKSALNQELDAEIEVLSAAPEDAEQLIVKLASRDAFTRAGIDRPFQLQQLKFKVFVKDDKPYVRVFTNSAIKEPFLSFLVEIDWPEGHMLREYTLLLDPPVYAGVEAAQSGRPAQDDGGRPFIDPAEQTYAQPVTAQQATSRPAQRFEQMQPAMPALVESRSASGEITYRALPQAQDVTGSYRVKENDTLWSMANRFRPDASISVEQMMLALVRENPEAFIAENIHGVKRGYILRMPERNSITSIDRQQALAQVREHAALWREYRQSQTGAAPASAMETEQGSDATQQPMAMTTEGQLSIVSASESEGGEADIAGQDPGAELSKLRSQLSMARESLESERLEKENLRARLNELEERVTRVLEMDDSELAKLQEDLQGTKQEIEAVAATPVMPEVVEPEMAVDDAQIAPEETQLAEEPGVVTLPPAETAEAPAVLEEAAEAPSGEEPLFVDETTATETAEVTPVTEPVIAETTAPAFVQTQPKSFIEKLLDQPSMLAAVGGAMLAVIALIALLIRRKRVNKAEDEWVAPETDELDDLGDDATVQMDATMKMAADDVQGEATDFDSDLEDTVMGLANEPEALAEPEAEQDDVLAEADVYLAYGIYQQAEDLLKNAINANPDRDDYRMKLLETHFAAKNSDAFASLAEDVKQRKGGDKSYWDRVVLMGRELCPTNAIFEAGSLDVAGLDTEDLLPQKPETTDLELDAGDMDSDATQVLSEPLDLSSFEAESGDSSMDDLGDLSDEVSGFDEDLALDETSDELAEDLEFNLGDLEETDTATEDDSSLALEDDFALDFEASDLGLEESAKKDAAEPDMSLSMDMDETDEVSMNLADDEELDLSMDMDVSGEDEVSLELDSGSEEELDLSMDMDTAGDEDVSLDLADDEELDLSMDMDAAVEDEVSFDMEDEAEVDLDMTADEALDLSMDAAEISIDEGDDEFDISSLSEEVDEVGTKLELARAYLEMGDKEGARSILDEVKQEGNDEQQKEAEELLQQAS